MSFGTICADGMTDKLRFQQLNDLMLQRQRLPSEHMRQLSPFAIFQSGCSRAPMRRSTSFTRRSTGNRINSLSDLRYIALKYCRTLTNRYRTVQLIQGHKRRLNRHKHNDAAYKYQHSVPNIQYNSTESMIAKPPTVNCKLIMLYTNQTAVCHIDGARSSIRDKN